MAGKNKKFIPEVGQEVECFCCKSDRDTPWIYPFIGYVKHIYNKSAMVIIKSTHPDDDGLVGGYDGRTIVPFFGNEGCEMNYFKCLLDVIANFLGCGLVLAIAMIVLAGVAKFGVLLWQMIF
ncbi:hypothetical protein [Enterococcus faecium]|uniref:hypothetical protein n=1 Tax=Enterococcus faecium TaxID=1352 RepID=UPI0021582ACD|nr:hypothetical protein [Enterococcus faecium]